MITWNDGIEYLPDGAPLREIAQRNVWTSSAWISPDGRAFRRYVDAVTEIISWEPIPMSVDAETQMRIGMHVSGTWMSNTTAIATAWLYRNPLSQTRVRVLDPAVPDVLNLAWGDPEINPEAGAEFKNETWKPLKWKIGPVQCDAKYRISSLGRLKNPVGKITRGHAAHKTRWAAVKGVGLVDLKEASSLNPKKTVSPRVHAAVLALYDGVPVAEHALWQRISLKLAWQYYCLAIALVQDRKIGRTQISPDLWRLLQDMCGDSVLGGKLTELQIVVSTTLSRNISFEELRFARICSI
jgi:hypothetical protein